jgi:hypothetical protein
MGLCDWLIAHGVDLFKTYRIEFKLIRYKWVSKKKYEIFVSWLKARNYKVYY